MLNEVGTPYTWRTFTNTAPTAKEGQLVWFFVCKKGISYAYFRWKCKKTGQQSDKNTPKTLLFPAPPNIWLSWAWCVAQQIRPNSVICLEKLEKQGFLLPFLSCFLPGMVHFVHLYAHNSDILKRNRTQLAFPGCRDHWYKSPPFHRIYQRQQLQCVNIFNK